MTAPRIAFVICLSVLALVVGAIAAPAMAQRKADELRALSGQIDQLREAGKYVEAVALAEKFVTLARERHGDQHPVYANALGSLGLLYLLQGRYADAEVLTERAISLFEMAVGPHHPVVGTGLSNLAGVYRAQGRYADAEPLLKRSLSIREKALGPEHQDVGQTLNILAELYRDQGRYTDAEPLYQRTLTIYEKAFGPDAPNVGTALDNFAKLYRAQARYAEAEPLLTRSLSVREKALGPDHADVATSLNNLAELYRVQGRYAEAEPFYKRSIAIAERALGPDHPGVAASLNNLAILYELQDRYAEAEPFFKRALAIYEKSLGSNHPDVATALGNLAGVYVSQRRTAEAEPLAKLSLSIREKALGSNHPDVASGLNSLALLHEAQGRFADAELLYKRSLSIREKTLGPDHSAVATSLNNLALLYVRQGRHIEAEPFNKRSLVIREKALGPDHPDVGESLINLAHLHFVQRDWSGAVAYLQKGTDVTVRRTKRGGESVGRALIGKIDDEAARMSLVFAWLVKAAHRLGEQDRQRTMFQTAQWALSSDAAASLAQMSARGAKGNAELSLLVRERQDLVAEWQKRDGTRSAAVSQAPDKRDPALEAANVARLAAIDVRIADIDKRLVADFPDYAALSRPEPLSVEEVQSQLRPDEALVLLLDTPEWQPTPEETFIWVVTKSDVRWVRSELGTPALKREVAALRCGLDSAAWDDDSGAVRCRELLKAEPLRDRDGNVRTETLPFDQARAYALYTALFGEVEDLIRDKHLLIVPSGPLTQLPFQLLVTASPASGDYRSAAWLARKHAITVLPAVSSLKALRRVAKPSAARKPMIGFGNPLLDGDPAERPWEAEWAKLARQKQACPQTPWQRVAGLFERRRGVQPMPTRSGRPDLDHLRSQSPLHDTADELCAVAKDLKLAADDIVLGARATEATVKRLSGEGRLASYRVLHFATHGTLSGEISGTSEPGLILTPPAEQSETDDGYLSASEVAGLKLDADWVILSACNTAAGGAAGAEALSGLARAFFYAGARALLVSHWAVDSASTVKLITSAVGTIARDKTVGRAEALRRAMLAMIATGEPKQAHPAFWAPFVVVGEGAR